MKISCELCGTCNNEITNYLCMIYCCNYYLCNKCASHIYYDIECNSLNASCHKCGDKDNYIASINLNFCLSSIISLANFIIDIEKTSNTKMFYKLIKSVIMKFINDTISIQSDFNKNIILETVQEQKQRIVDDIRNKKQLLKKNVLLLKTKYYMKFTRLFII